MHAPISHDARLGKGFSWQVGLLACSLLCGIGCSGCNQSAVVPPITSITPPTRPLPALAPVISQPIEQISPPDTRPIEPIITSNPWKPDAELREWNYIVLHHTASNIGSVDTIHEEHLKRKDKKGNHWLGIGYHFVIGNGQGMTDGEIEPTFRWRQQIQGAHAGVADFNQRGIGIVLIGNFERTPPTDAQVTSVKKLVGILKQEYGIDRTKVIGHGDVKATECPGKLFPMNEIRDSMVSRDEQAAAQTAFPNAVSLINLPGDSRK
jgi:hypothetical protein